MKTQILFAVLSLLSTDLTHASNYDEAPFVADACADFSGSWRGTCTTNGQTATDVMIVTQSGCESMNLGGQNVVVGGTTNESHVESDLTTTTIISAAWKQSKTELAGKLIIIQLRKGESGQKYAQLDTSVKLDGTRLLVTARGQDIDASCSYDRQ